MIDKNDIRNSLKKMRNYDKNTSESYESTKKLSSDPSMRDMLKKMRKLNEDNKIKSEKTTTIDLERERQKLQDNFDDLEVNTEIVDFEVYDEAVFLSGVIDDEITFTYTVSPSEDASGIEWTATDEYDTETPENQEVIERLESYYKEFYKYWRDNELQI